MTETVTDPSRARTEALVERVFHATIDALELASIHVGHRLGLYRALAAVDAATPDELAAGTGTVERYVREWLEQQAVAGFVEVDEPATPAVARRYRLPAAHRPVLVDETDLSYLVPLATLAIGVTRPMDELLAAYRDGGGVPYERYGADTREGIEAVNRPMFEHQLAGWFAAIPEIDARLRGHSPARVADIACGSAWSSIAIARAYPDVVVDAIDVDEASIDTARTKVAALGLGDRVRPFVHDASAPDLQGRYDLVTIFEALHDMNHPVEALRNARALIAEGGCLLVADERVAEHFAAPGDEIERFNYGWSVLHCLAVGMLDPDSEGTGTVIRPDTVRDYASRAGFSAVEVLPIEHDFWRFYRLTP